MKKNIGSIEQYVRILLGLFIASLAFWGPETPWAFAGLIFVATGFIKYCPIWHVMGISTVTKIETEKLNN